MNQQKNFDQKIQREKQNYVFDQKFETNAIQKKIVEQIHTKSFEIENFVDT